MHFPRRLWQLLRWQRLVGALLSPEPAARLIRESALRHWRLMAVNLATNLVEGLSEGVTFAVIFLAVGLITADSAEQWLGMPGLQVLKNWPWGLQGIETLASSSNGREVIFLALLLAAVLLQGGMALARYVNSVSAGVLAARLDARITEVLHRRILSLSFACASGYRVGDLINYASSGGGTVRSQIEQVNALLVNSTQLIVYLAILIGISPWLFFVALAMATLLRLFQRQLLPRVRMNAQEVQSNEVEIISRLTEDIQGLRLLHSTGQLRDSASSFDQLLRQAVQLRIHQSQLVNVIPPISNLLPVVAVAVIAASSLLLFDQRSSGVLPSLITFVLALQRLNVRMGQLSGVATNLVLNSAQLERLNGILCDEGKQFVRHGGVPFSSLRQGVQFQGVTLRYGRGLEPALRNVNLTIPYGHTVALVGPSGAGKSSIVDLLVGLYEPSQGRILVDGVDLCELDLADWQQLLGVVSQDTFLFNATIAANISHGCPWATVKEIKQAATRAQAARFIESLPKGYDTLIGERGYRLSGGQRQRISLARAILRDPELLILDEATSALDSESERLVQQAIEQCERNRTVLVVAHRLSTVISADEILVLESGSIIERGSHLDLLGRGSRYAELWRLQSNETVLLKS